MQREKDRLAALEQLDLLDTPRDEGFERIVRRIRAIFAIDIGLISLIDAGRLGGEEFAIVLPHVNRDGAIVVAEKVKTAISSQLIRGGFGSLKVTASLGISALSIVGEDIETLLAQADAAMYQAKHQGRNRCVSWGSSPADSTMAQRRVLKSGSIIFNDRRSTMECTGILLGSDSAAYRSTTHSAFLRSSFSR